MKNENNRWNIPDSNSLLSFPYTNLTYTVHLCFNNCSIYVSVQIKWSWDTRMSLVCCRWRDSKAGDTGICNVFIICDPLTHPITLLKEVPGKHYLYQCIEKYTGKEWSHILKSSGCLKPMMMSRDAPSEMGSLILSLTRHPEVMIKMVSRTWAVSKWV